MKPAIFALVLFAAALAPAPLFAISEAEAEAFAKKIEADIVGGQGRLFQRSLDIDALLAKATQGVAVDPGYKQGFLNGAKRNNQLSAQLMTEIGRPGASYTFLRLRSKGEEHRPLFRLLTADGSLNYHEFVLARSGTRLVIEDLFVYTSGELLSQTLRWTYLSGAAAVNRGGANDPFIQNMAKVGEITQLRGQGQLKKAYTDYCALPADFRAKRFVGMIGLQLALQSGDEAAYARELGLFEKEHGADPRCKLMLLDVYFIKGQFKKTVAAVDEIDKSVGGDPYLEVLRSNCHLQLKEPAKARACAERAIYREPDLLAPYWSLVQVGLTEKDHAAVLKTLKLMDQRFEFTWNDLRSQPEYKDFVASPQHQEWVAYLASQKKR